MLEDVAVCTAIVRELCSLSVAVLARIDMRLAESQSQTQTDRQTTMGHIMLARRCEVNKRPSYR